MKKVITVLFIISGLIFLGSSLLSLKGAINPFRRINQSSYSYEYLYLKSSTLQKAEIDGLFVTLLIEANINDMSFEQVAEVINNIKQTIVESGEFDTFTYRGMMGRNSDYACHIAGNSIVYEWYYIHSDNDTRTYMEETFIQNLVDTDMQNLTIIEVTSQIESIKNNIIETITLN